MEFNNKSTMPSNALKKGMETFKFGFQQEIYLRFGKVNQMED